jgi:hypothetical protein
MSTYTRNTISKKMGEYTNTDEAPTTNYDRDDEYSRYVSSRSHDSQRFVDDGMLNRAMSSRRYQADLNEDDDMLESNVSASHMRPSALSQRGSALSNPAAMDMIDHYRESNSEIEEPESSRNGSIQQSGRIERAACKTSTIYRDINGVITPSEINMNDHCGY